MTNEVVHKSTIAMTDAKPAAPADVAKEALGALAESWGEEAKDKIHGVEAWSEQDAGDYGERWQKTHQKDAIHAAQRAAHFALALMELTDDE